MSSAIENSPNPAQSTTPLRRRKARPFSVMVSKKDTEDLPEYPVYSDHISPELAQAMSHSISSKSPEGKQPGSASKQEYRKSFMLSGLVSSPMSQSKSNIKKRMASDLVSLSERYCELEGERMEEAELHASLLRSVEEASNKKAKLIESLTDEQELLRIEYHKAKAEYLMIKQKRDTLKSQLDEKITKSWKNHVYSVQSNSWFSEFEKSFQ